MGMPLGQIKDASKLRRLVDAVLVVERDLSLRVVLETIVKEAASLVNAQYGALGVIDPSGTYLVDFIVTGLSADEIQSIGELPKGHGLLGTLITTSEPLIIDSIEASPLKFGFPANHPQMSTFLGVPITVGERVFGNLYLTDKLSNDGFDHEDQILVDYLARAAGIAIENARLHATVAEFALKADRERIARELHDEIIQRLFAIGLSLQATMRSIEEDSVFASVQNAIDDIDEAIKKIRATIFALETSKSRMPSSFRSSVMALLKELHPVLGFEPSVSFTGPIDTLVGNKVATNGLSVIREAISNVAKHARASKVDISIEAGSSLTIIVDDNGVGYHPSNSDTSKGVKNLSQRASELGGSVEIGKSTKLRGARLLFSVPLNR
ncbi:MAG: GAF domain-containing protein [Actinomycetota bacterium]|nr:GAF domain-containing protein [Actinomycetota bacterium]